jgi:type IV secretory pathway TrbD component
MFVVAPVNRSVGFLGNNSKNKMRRDEPYRTIGLLTGTPLVVAGLVLREWFFVMLGGLILIGLYTLLRINKR